METARQHAARRYAVFAEQVLEPLAYPETAPLRVQACQCDVPIPLAEAQRRAYRPVEPGWRWGPVWSTAWFRLAGEVPRSWAGRDVVLRFACGTEALLWLDGTPRQGLDDNHPAAPLLNPARGGESLQLYVEAACNHPLGAARFAWLETEFNRRWNTPAPGILERCELAVFDERMWRAWRTFDFARRLLATLDDDSDLGAALDQALRRCVGRIDPHHADRDAAEAVAELTDALRSGAAPTASRAWAVGHAHIDTAWLWRTRETRRKCLRSFATALGLMERYDDFHFLCSQAQHYAWVEQDAPDLFARIAERVAEGRWEPGGAMWVEPDCNVPSGESLVRQIVLGTRYWVEKFGDRGRQRFLFLPDSFGFSAALPQIMRLAGLDVFITNKLHWNDTNPFPHMNFRWRGIDGSEVLAHLTPGRDYNATNTPSELRRGAQTAAQTDAGRTGLYLQPFGFGDGGGGPTDWMIENARLARRCAGLPRVKLAPAGGFCEALRAARRRLRDEGRDLPVWDGELYLEYHRGTFTSQAWLKRANRRAENDLFAAELLAFAGPAPPSATEVAAARERLDETWKLLSLNQFHDILPGSSIGEVYDDARRDLAQIGANCRELIDAGLDRWAAQADTRGLSRPMLVFNPAASGRCGIVQCAGQTLYVEHVPALGVAVVDRAAARVPRHPVRVENWTLSNGLISATIDEVGRVVSLRQSGGARDACGRDEAGNPRPLNQLVLYDDRPRAWDAWDIDAEYLESARPVTTPAERRRVIEAGPLRGVIEVARPLGRASRIVQRFILAAGSPRLDIHTRVEWHEQRTLLRALLPVDVRARYATYEIQFGHLRRPTFENTPWDRARFEVCAQRWMDLSEPGFGVALLNDCKYGHSCRGNVMGLSLLRGPKFPDEHADQGSHEFTYALMPHGGDWRAAGVPAEAEALNRPLIARALPADQAGAVRRTWAPFAIATEGAAGVGIAALKRAERDGRLIVRLFEQHGGRGAALLRWNRPIRAAQRVDLLEAPLPGAAPVTLEQTDAGTTVRVELRPFEIITIAATPGD